MYIMSETKKFDIVNLKDKIKQVQKKISEMVKENKTEIEIEMHFLENDSKFYEEYPYLIKKLMKGDGLEFLDVMLNNLQKVEEGEQSLASTELKLGEELANKYLHPEINKNNE